MEEACVSLDSRFDQIKRDLQIMSQKMEQSCRTSNIKTSINPIQLLQRLANLEERMRIIFVQSELLKKEKANMVTNLQKVGLKKNVLESSNLGDVEVVSHVRDEILALESVLGNYRT